MAQGASSRRRREPWGGTKTLQLEKNLTVPALGPRQCCRGAAVPGHQRPTGWPLPQEAPSSLAGAIMINHPGFVTLASTFSGPWVCSAPPHHQARSLSTTVLPWARAAQMLAKQEGSSRHISLCPRTPRSLLFQPQEPKIPFPSAIFACPGLTVLLGGTGCCPTPGQVWGNGLVPRPYPARVGAEGVLTGLFMFLHEIQAARYCPRSV